MTFAADSLAIPLADVADATLRRLAEVTRSARVAALDGATLLGERATLYGYRIPGRTSAGGGCVMIDAADRTIALNLARPEDRALLPAWLETDMSLESGSALARAVAARAAAPLVERGRLMGLAVADVDDDVIPPDRPWRRLVPGIDDPARPERAPRVLDLSALWAGPLAAHLLWLAGAEVVRVESRARADIPSAADARFDALLNQGKAGVALDLTDSEDRTALLRLIAAADIVIESARPRALRRLGIHADRLVAAKPGLVWIGITGHGGTGEAADWVGFGDDAAVAAGLAAALRRATGRVGFVGDAVADPLTGLHAALAASEAWAARRGGLYGLSLRGVAAWCLSSARTADPDALETSLSRWARAKGGLFPAIVPRPVDARVAWRGADTRRVLAAC